MRYFIVVISFFCAQQLFGQTQVIQERFTKRDGLAIDFVQTMAHDTQGFLWLGGGNLQNREILFGQEAPVLQRFDGSRFHSIAIPTSKKPSVVHQIFPAGDLFYMIVEDVEGQHHLLVFDPYRMRFKEIDVQGARYLTKIYPYKGALFLLSQKDLVITVHKLNTDDGLEPVFRFTRNSNAYAVDVKTTLILNDGGLLISDDNFPTVRLSWEGLVKQEFSKINNGSIYSGDYLDTVFEEQGAMYGFFLNNPTLQKISSDSHRVTAITKTKHELQHEHVKAMNDSQGNAVIVRMTNEGVIGIYKYDPERGFVNRYKKRLLDEGRSFSVHASNVSKELYLSIDGGELYYFKFPPAEVKTFLPDEEMRAITILDSSRLLLATQNGGWYTLHRSTGAVKPYVIKERGESILPYASRAFFKQKEYIWSHDGSRVIKIDTVTREMQASIHYPILCIVAPTDSTLVYGTKDYHLVSFNKRTKEHTHIAQTDSLHIFDLAYRPEHNIIVGATDKGMLLYDIENKKATLAQKELEDQFLLMADYHPSFGYLLGSRSGVITAYDPKEKAFTKVYKDPLKAGIATLLFDDENRWWINTFNGTIFFDPESGRTKRYSINDGLSHNEANRYSALKTEEGFYIGALKGLTFFNPDTLAPESDQADLELLRIRTFDTDTNNYLDQWDQSGFPKARQVDAPYDPIILPTENRALEVDFSLNNVNVLRNERYQYRLNDAAWVDLAKNKTLRFSNLEAGSYLLTIRALDFSGEQIGQLLELPIVSKQFFYKTGWFFTMLVLIVAGLLFWWLKQAQMRRRLQEQFSKELLFAQEDERSRIAKELHDSVGQQLTLIKQTAQIEQMPRVAQMSHETLEEVRAISRNLYPAVINQLGLTGALEQLTLQVDEQSDLFVSSLIDPIDTFFDEQASLQVYRFTQEAIANILKHAQATTASIEIEVQAREVHIEIADNGKGFDTEVALKKQSLGLKTLEERIKILNGTLEIQSAPYKGTKLIAKVPKK